YEGATTQKIAERAGVNEVTLYRRYRSKADLFEQAIRQRLSDTTLAKVAYTGDLEADLRTVVEAYIETNDLHGDIVPLILLEAPRNPEMRRSLDIPWNNVQVVLKILERYRSQGLLKDESPLASLSALIGPIMVSQMFRRANPDIAAPAVEPNEYVDAFLHGRLVQPGGPHLS
ncbi:MAG: TetR/AcrR family transcriptional regulator, partial [Anaerolineales bacterium]